jgi:hypothetical protein
MYVARTNLGVTGSTSGAFPWVMMVDNTFTAAGTDRNSLLVTGRCYVDGVLNALTKSFDNPHPKREDKAIRYNTVEAPEHAIMWRTSVKKMPKSGRVEIDVPEWVTLCLPDKYEMDVWSQAFVGHARGWHDTDKQKIVVVGDTACDGRVMILCFGTRRYFEEHEPIVDHDWSSQRKVHGSPARAAYGPL